jgi:hypothetical protein
MKVTYEQDVVSDEENPLVTAEMPATAVVM